VNYQQIGNTWSGQTDLVSLSVSGALNIFDPRTGDKPVRVFNVSPSFSCTWYLDLNGFCSLSLQAPRKSITSITPSFPNTFLAGGADGRIYPYSPSTQELNVLNGEGHTNNVSVLTTSFVDGKMYSIAFDEHSREIEGDGSGFVCVHLLILISLFLILCFCSTDQPRLKQLPNLNQ
jgi:WD40 repeat protein